MNKTISSSFTILCLLSTASALIINLVNANEATYIKQTYGGSRDDGAYSMMQTADGGYILAGYTNSFGAGGGDVWLVKTNASGNHEWKTTYGGTSHERVNSVVQTVDSGYVLAGWTNSFGAGKNDVWLVKTDTRGNREWNHTYGGASGDLANSVVETVDGGYILVGSSSSFGAGDYDVWLVKTDSSGNHEWNHTYGGPNSDTAWSVVQTVDGGYVLAGSTYSFGGEGWDFWLVKTDSRGNHVWNQTYGGADSDCGYSVVQTADEGYTITGYTWSFGAGAQDLWLVKTDSRGNHVWNQTYGGADSDCGYSVVLTMDEGFAIAGLTSSFGAGSTDFWLVKTNASGNHVWNHTYGGANTDDARGVVQTVDGGYALAGYTESFGAGGRDFLLVKTDQYGVLLEPHNWTLILRVILVVVIIFAVTMIIYLRRTRNLERKYSPV